MPDQQENGLRAESGSPQRRRRRVAASAEVESPVLLDTARPPESPAAPTKRPRRSRKAAAVAATPATASPGSPVDDEAAEAVAHAAPAVSVGAPELPVREATVSSPSSETASVGVAEPESAEAQAGLRRGRRRATRQRSRTVAGDEPGPDEASTTGVVEDGVNVMAAPSEESADASEAEMAAPPTSSPTGHRRRRRHRQKGAAAKAAETTPSPGPEPVRAGAARGETRHPAHAAAHGPHAGGRPKRGAHPSSRSGEPRPGNVREPERTRRGPIIDPRRRPGPGEGTSVSGRTSTAQAIGKISEIARGRGYGFLIDGAGRKRFFHRSAVLGGAFDSLREGQTVQFQPRDDVKGLRAINVRPAGAWRGDRPGAFERGATRRGGQAGARGAGRATDGRSPGTAWRSSLSPFRGDPPSPVPRRRR
jgi:cold shock CspA family protein